MVSGVAAAADPADYGIVPILASDVAPLTQIGPEALELAFWQSIQASREVSDFLAYLDQYPEGSFATLARARADAIEQVSGMQSRLDVVIAQRDDAEALLQQRERSLREARSLSIGAREQVERLNREIEALLTQLARVETALRLREEEIEERDVETASLTERLNLALLQEVEDLSRYSADFFTAPESVVGWT